MAENTIEEVIAEAAAENVRSVTVDGLTVSGHSIQELIAADNHTKSKAHSNNPFGAMRAAKLRPPGTTGYASNS